MTNAFSNLVGVNVVRERSRRLTRVPLLNVRTQIIEVLRNVNDRLRILMAILTLALTRDR